MLCVQCILTRSLCPLLPPTSVLLCCRYLPTFLFLLSFALNICTFGLFGLHWAYLATNGPAASRRDSCFHFASYLLAAGLLSLGIWCRTVSVSGVLDCPNGEEMSLECLYHTQPPLYRFIYTIHYFGLAWIALHLVIDILHIPRWCVEIYKKKTTLSMFYSGWGGGRVRTGRYAEVAIGGISTSGTSCNSGNGNLNANADTGTGGEGGNVSSTSSNSISSTCQIILTYFQPVNFSYFHWLLLVWISVTLTWTVFVDWSTGDANGVQGLARAEFAQMFGYFVLICVYYYVQ